MRKAKNEAEKKKSTKVTELLLYYFKEHLNISVFRKLRKKKKGNTCNNHHEKVIADSK